MTMEFKELMEKERLESKERMKKESSGTYVLLYFMLGLYVFMSSLWGFKYESYKDMPNLFFFAVGYFFCLFFNRYLYSVREYGKDVNIFQKYRYIPVNLKKLFLAKLVLISKNICIVTVLAQAAALLIRILDLDKDGGRISDVTVWMPVIFGGVIWVMTAGRLFYLVKKAKLKKTRKKAFLLLLSIFCFSGIWFLCPQQACAKVIKGTCGENVKWTYNARTKVLDLSGKGTVTEPFYKVLKRCPKNSEKSTCH